MVGEPNSTRSTLGTLALVLALVAGFALLPRVFHGREGGGVGHDAPDFTLDVVANGASLGPDKHTLRLSELRGSAVLLDFWATWCHPCRAEAPIVDRVARRWKERGLVAVGVNEDGADEGDPAEFAREVGLTYPIVRDRAGSAMRAYGTDSLPTLVVLSRAGKVTAVRTGMTDDVELERLVRQAL